MSTSGRHGAVETASAAVGDESRCQTLDLDAGSMYSPSQDVRWPVLGAAVRARHRVRDRIVASVAWVQGHKRGCGTRPGAAMCAQCLDGFRFPINKVL